MTVSLRVLAAGPVCTIQDQGRRGFLRFGVTTAGPMDWVAHSEARLLAGEAADGAAIEIGPGGLACIAEGGPLRIGLSARGFDVRVGAEIVKACGALTVRPGERITISPGRTHLWAYLAWSGETLLEPVMGSLSTHLRSGIAPLNGKALSAGTIIPVEPTPGADARPAIECPAASYSNCDSIRIILGPQAEYFTHAALEMLCAMEYRVTDCIDRMGYRLQGPPLPHARGHDIVSDGTVMGAIQIPGDGQPIVLMADRQPTGGYPKIGTVIRADLPALAQARPGTIVRFSSIAVEEAVVELELAMTSIAKVRTLDLRRSVLNTDLLLSGHCSGGVVDAMRNPFQDAS